MFQPPPSLPMHIPTPLVYVMKSQEQIAQEEALAKAQQAKLEEINQLGTTRLLPFNELLNYYEGKIDRNSISCDQWSIIRNAPVKYENNLTEKESQVINQARDKIIKYAEDIVEGIITAWLINKIKEKRKKKRTKEEEKNAEKVDIHLTFESPKDEKAKPLSLIITKYGTVITVPFSNQYADFSPQNKQILVRQAKSGEETERIKALNELALFNNKDIKDILLDLTMDESEKISMLAISLLSEVEGDDITKFLIEKLHNDKRHQEWIAELLSNRGNPTAIKDIIASLPLEYWGFSQSAQYIYDRLFSRHMLETLEALDSFESAESLYSYILPRMGKLVIAPFCRYYNDKKASEEKLKVFNQLVVANYLFFTSEQRDTVNDFLVGKLGIQSELASTILEALKLVANEKSAEQLIKLFLSHDNGKTGEIAQEIIVNIGAPALKHLTPILEESPFQVQQKIIEIIGQIYFNPDADIENSYLRRDILSGLQEARVTYRSSEKWKWKYLGNKIEKEKQELRTEIEKYFRTTEQKNPSLKPAINKVFEYTREPRPLNSIRFKLRFFSSKTLTLSENRDIGFRFTFFASCVLIIIIFGLLMVNSHIDWRSQAPEEATKAAEYFFASLPLAGLLMFSGWKFFKNFKKDITFLYAEYISLEMKDNINSFFPFLTSRFEAVRTMATRKIASFGSRSMDLVINRLRQNYDPAYMSLLSLMSQLRGVDILFDYINKEGKDVATSFVNKQASWCIGELLEENGFEELSKLYAKRDKYLSDDIIRRQISTPTRIGKIRSKIDEKLFILRMRWEYGI